MPHDREKRDRMERQSSWVSQLVAQAQVRGFYGKLVITMESGEVRRVVKEESLKPPLG